MKVQCDYIPKYCKECRLQGHNEEECRRLYPNLILAVETQSEAQVQSDATDKNQVQLNNIKPTIRMLTSGKIVGYPNGRWMEVKDSRPKKDHAGKEEEKKRKEVTVKETKNMEQKTKDPIQTKNKFALLEEGEIEEAI